MQIVINPKDNNQFASASLDRTIKVILFENLLSEIHNLIFKSEYGYAYSQSFLLCDLQSYLRHLSQGKIKFIMILLWFFSRYQTKTFLLLFFNNLLNYNFFVLSGLATWISTTKFHFRRPRKGLFCLGNDVSMQYLCNNLHL